MHRFLAVPGRSRSPTVPLRAPCTGQPTAVIEAAALIVRTFVKIPGFSSRANGRVYPFCTPSAALDPEGVQHGTGVHLGQPAHQALLGRCLPRHTDGAPRCTECWSRFRPASEPVTRGTVTEGVKDGSGGAPESSGPEFMPRSRNKKPRSRNKKTSWNHEVVAPVWMVAHYEGVIAEIRQCTSCSAYLGTELRVRTMVLAATL